MFFANPFTLRKRGVLGMNDRNINYINPLNPRKYLPLVDNKLNTKKIAEEAGISVPKLLKTMKYQAELKELGVYLKTLNAFVIKPCSGSGGKGILVITKRKGNVFRKNSGEYISLREIYYHASNIISGLYSLGGKNDVVMIEALVEFDPIFEPYSYEGVPDVRVVLYKGYPAMAMLRCSTSQSDGKANLHQGAVGVGLNMKNGKALSAVQFNQPIKVHPDTQQDFTKLQVPYWKEILHLAASCYEITHLGYLGVDIVIDKNLGPLILELNARPGLAIQIANKEGELPRFKKIDTQLTTVSSKKRVAFSMKNF